MLAGSSTLARPRSAVADERHSIPLERFAGWGGGPPARARARRPQTVEVLAESLGSGALYTHEELASATAAGAIPRGLGRSYGDAAHRTLGVVIDTRALRAISLDPATGIVRAEAGVSLRELLAAVIGSGWILPVVPGTQHVTVGGAIAADIHGKNHGTLGTFSRHVRSLGLLTSAGELLELEAGDPRFDATVGGMGLTGVIAWARIALRRVRSGILLVDADRADSLDETFAILDSRDGGEHRVAWLDLLAGTEPRGVVTRAAHFDRSDGTLRAAVVTARSRATVPQHWPSGLLRPVTVRAFNELRFQAAPRRARGHPERYGAHMFPLDGLDAWPRLYGPHGFLQYQFVVPRGAQDTIRHVLARLAAARIPCYLAVLKDFGPAATAPLSFPAEGWTLALDLPAAAPGLRATLDRCDELVAGAGGRVYLAKDARLRPDTLRAMYPRLEEWRRIRDELDPAGLWRSDLAARTRLLEDG